MLDVHDLPGLNAILNATSAALVLCGLVFVKRGRIVAHKRCMLAATGISAAFLASYVAHKVLAGVTYYPEEKGHRALYLAILVSHTILAIVNVPLIVMTLIAGLRDRIDRHRKLARFTLPSWLYVSVTGVVVYWMLYR